MRKLPTLLLALGTIWIALTAGTEAFATDPTPATTAVSSESVTPPGAELQRRQRTEVRSVPERTNMVSVAWAGDPGAEFRVETRRDDGAWVDRGTVGEADGGTDPGTQDAVRGAATGTELVSEPILVKSPDDVRLQVAAGTVAEVEVTAFATDVTTPPLPVSQTAAMVPGIGLVAVGGLIAIARNRRKVTATLVVVTLAAGAVGIAAATEADAAAPGDVPWPAQPRIVTRAELGIDESLRLSVCPSGPDYAKPRMAIVHHTVNGNDYSPAGAADIVRNLYAYFINSRGYCDQGYNFFVDKYGTIYEGRHGGITQGVVGAHATNFNTGSFGVAMIGDHGGVVPSTATVNAISNLVAWKFTIHNINPNALAPAFGSFVDPILGHRDAGALSGDGTGCPGNAGYSILAQVRNNVRPRVAFGWPLGALDSADRSLGGARIVGWTLDPDVATPIQVHFYVDGNIAGVTTANLSRPDIGAAYPGYGNNHGFDAVIPMTPGPHTVCAWGISVANGSNGLLGCRAVRDTPIGNIEVVRREGGPIRVVGWTLDPASANSLPVHVYVDGVGAAITTASGTRTDVGNAFPGYGNAHGFDLTIPTTNGNHNVCVYSINSANTEVGVLGCRAVPGGTIGVLDIVRREGGPVRVNGWTLDFDTASSIPVHVYVDGVGTAITTASLSRSDVGAFFSGYGNNHGFETIVPVTPGPHTVCAYGVGIGPDPVTLVGCRAIAGAPIGSLDEVSTAGGTVRARGWAIDPSTSSPASVHIYVDGIGTSVAIANVSRPDVGLAFPGFGTAHGYDLALPITPSGHTVCAYGIGAPPGGNSVLGCRRI